MGIRWYPGSASSAGVILNAGPSCRGFRVAPGVPSKNDASNSALKSRPGSYPVRVRERGTNNIIPVRNGDAFYFAEEFAPQGFDLVDLEQGDCWDVFVFDGKADGVIPNGRKRTVPVRIADTTAVPNGTPPSLATDGWPLRPGVVSITSYFTGTPRLNTLWVRLLDGTWFSTGDTVDNTAAGAFLYDTRDLRVPGDRFYWQATGAGQTVIVEAEMEVG